jgi:hypothetical protein
MKKGIIIGALCALLAGGGSALAISPDAAPIRHLFDGHHIKKGTVAFNRLTPKTQALIRKAGAPGQDGSNGSGGPVGPKGAKGDTGDAVMAGAYYSVAFYDVGDTNAGAIATVACSAQTDTAIGGGVQVLGLDAGANSRNTPVSSSFPGRMDWDTNTPKVGRLDGWIVQFGGNAGATSDKDPQKEKVWALCVPGLSPAVTQTYQQSVDG